MTGNVSVLGNIFPDVAIKAPVRVATLSTSSPIAHSGLQTIDGIALAEGDRVLDKDQLDQTLNGIWQASSGNWIRPTDADGNTDFVDGTQVIAAEGTVSAGQMFVLTTSDSPVVIGTSDLVFMLRQEVVNTPGYQWSGTSIQFRNPDGTWGAFVNLQGPVGPANSTMLFDTVAQLNAATVPGGITHVYLFGYYSPLDGGAKNMISVGAIPGGADPNLYHTSNGGTLFWQIDEPDRMTPEMCGAKGDGTTDDRPAVQSANNALAAGGGGKLEYNPLKTYRCVINSGVTDLGLIASSGVTHDINMARINLECTGSVYGFRLQSNAHLVGPGSISTTVSISPGSQDIWHAPVSIGAATGEVTSVSALGNYVNATRWSVRRLKIANARSGGSGIAGIGGVSHGLIEDIEYPDSSTLIGCINFDWGTVGSISSVVANIPASRVAYDAGTAYTVHPNNIDVHRLKIGVMSNAASCPIRLSGVHAIRVEDFEIAQCSTYGLFFTAGDLGYEFAQANSVGAITSNIRRRGHSGVVFRNGSISVATSGAIYCDAYADNLALAVLAGYTAYSNSINETDILFENIHSYGILTSSAGDGVTARYMEGGVFRNCYMLGHLRGIVVAEAAKRVRIQGGEVNSCQQDGIYIGAGTVPEEITVDGTWCWSNGIGATSAGIYAAAGKRHTITRCRLGNVGESFQAYGVHVDPSNASDVEVSFNHTIGHASGGVAYNLGTSTSYGCVRLFTGNTTDPLYVTTPMGGLSIVPVRYDYYSSGLVRHFVTSRASVFTVTPGSGTWITGDTIDFVDPLASGFTGSKCVAGGSPGTWKNYGQLTS